MKKLTQKKSWQLSIVETFPKGEKEVCITVGDRSIAIPEKEISKFFEDVAALKLKMQSELKTVRTGVGQYTISQGNPNIELKVFE